MHHRLTDIVRSQKVGRFLKAALFAASSLVVLFWLGAPSSHAQINPASPTTSWTPVLYPAGNPITPDPTADQQTGSSEADIIGTTNQASFYISFHNAGTPLLTDGQFGMRLRLAADKSPTGFDNVAFVGIDGNQDGRLDLFVGVDNQGSGDRIGIWRPTAGTNLNISPNTTSINTTALFEYGETAANYSWIIVNNTVDPTGSNFNIDGAPGAGEEDRFLSFVVPFADIVSAMATVGLTNFNENTAVNYVVGTSSQLNSINQDINGVNGGVNSTTNWVNLGALSQTYTIAAVPEPQSYVLVGLGLVGLALSRRRFRS